MEDMMRKKEFMKRGLVFSMALAMGMGAVPMSGLTDVTPVYAAEQTVLKKFDFDDGIGGWYYGSGWEYDYSAGGSSSVEADNGQLKFHVDYSADKDKGWSQATAVWEPTDGKGMNLSGATSVTLDLFYEASKMKTGAFAVKVYCDEGLDAYADLDLSAAETVSGDIKKIPVEINFEALPAKASDVKKLAVQLIGKNTDYKGAVWFDDICIAAGSASDVSVDSTITVKDTQQITVSDGALVTYKEDGSEQKTKLAATVSMADKKATAQAKKLYAYLKAVGASDSVIYGHQNDIHHKAGNADLSNSDTKDVTGSISGVFGIDALSLTGNEYSAGKYNETHTEALKETISNNVRAAALLSNEAAAEGAIITLSAHMPNFAAVEKNKNYKSSDPTYAKYIFNGYSPNSTENDPMNQILPGGKYNEIYNAYLDMIADYAKKVDSAIIFRPFHENTGSWFWWGAAFCDAETFKNVYRYTVEYLRDTKNIHNLIYAYSPSNTGAGTVADYELRYPGDAYVDLVGFDMYDRKPANDGVFMKQFKKQLAVVEKFAKKHGKLVAVTETGAADDPAPGDNQTALLKSGNENKDWYNQILDIVSESEASYFLLWANFGKADGFYSPYVDAVNEDGSLHGHEMLDNFISFYNDGRSIFAKDQKDVLTKQSFGKITAKAAAAGVTGYITSPIADQRILKAVTIQAKVTGASADTAVKFVLKAGKNKVTLKAKSKGKGYYTAKLSAAKLKKLGKKVGTLSLYIDGKKAQTISETYNIKAAKADPYLIDGFENYYGVDDQLTRAWTTNADSDCKVTLALQKSRKSEGTYGLKFTYDETATGWGGATISKEVDWSDCNALQFYTIPDGKNQKVVIQITANGVVYEAYLNTYSAYQKNGGKPILVTIPFSEFCQRDTEGNPKGGLAKDRGKIQSFGLWVNAISDSPAVTNGRVKGTIYYDNITAVKSSAKKATFQVVK